MEQKNLVDEFERLFTRIEGTLIRIATSRKISNCRDEVCEWKTSAFLIMRKFDEGHFVKKVRNERLELEVLSEQSEFSTEAFEKSLSNYLCRSWVNHLNKKYKKNKREERIMGDNRNVVAESSISSYSVLSATAPEILDEYIVRIKDFSEMVHLDLKRIDCREHKVNDLIFQHFISSILEYCTELYQRGSDWENLIIVPNLNEMRNRCFFSLDFRGEMEECIRHNLCKRILEEVSPETLKGLDLLVKKTPLRKRISRYLFEYRGGMPSRFRKKSFNYLEQRNDHFV